MDGLAVEPAVVQVHHSFLGILLTPELHINIADEVIAQIITHVHLLHLAVLLLHFREDFLEKLIIMLLHFHIAHGTARGVGCLSTVLRVTVDVLDQDGLAESWFIMESGAAVSMSTSSNLKVEGAVDPG